MRRLIVLVITLAAGLIVLAAPPVSAGGPTSVLVVNLSGERAAVALNGSDAYLRLSRVLDAETPPAGGQAAPAGVDEGRTQVRVVWLVHDVSPWRVDRVVIDGTDVWVNTAMSAGEVLTPGGPGTWHRPKDVSALLGALTSLGVIGAPQQAAPGGPAGAPSVAEAPAAANPLAASAPSTSNSTPTRTTPAEWSIAMAGGLVALGGGVLLGRRTAPRPRDSVAGARRPVDSVGPTRSGRTGQAERQALARGEDHEP